VLSAGRAHYDEGYERSVITEPCATSGNWFLFRTAHKRLVYIGDVLLRKFVVSRPNRQRPLPRPIVLPDVPLRLTTLADVQTLVQKRLPATYRAKPTWQRVAAVTSAAARGQLPPDDVATALKMVLSPHCSRTLWRGACLGPGLQLIESGT
jgi:hypothetical protein